MVGADRPAVLTGPTVSWIRKMAMGWKKEDKKQEDTKSSTLEIRASIRRSLQQFEERAATGEFPVIRERRSGEDRRGWQAMPPLPFADSNGLVVTRDRRRIPDRRVHNINVKWDKGGSGD